MSSWVVDMEKKLQDAELPAKVERWPKHCIFRVPPRFKLVDERVYKPNTVSLGPFHHGKEELRPMEEHKLRAVGHLLHRESCKTNLTKLFAAVEEVAQELEDSYMDLGDEWRDEENRGKFLQMMITDGCFLLEVMRMAVSLQKKESIAKDYAHDPVFSWHGIRHIKPFVERDMLMVENQLPLRLLERIIAVESGTPPSATSINSLVLQFLCGKDAPEGIQLGLHSLDIYRASQLKGFQNHLDSHTSSETMPRILAASTMGMIVPRTASEMTMGGLLFGPNDTSCLDDMYLSIGTLRMPRLQLDDSTVYRFRNMMAFEVLHVGTTNNVTAYVLFVSDLINSSHDVRLLASAGILEHHTLANEDAVVRLFKGLTMDVAHSWEPNLLLLRIVLEQYCIYKHPGYHVDRFLRESWAILRSKYLRSPWTFLGLLAATFLLVADIVQAVYAVKSYKGGK